MGRIRGFCIFPKETRVQTVRDRGGVCGSVSAILRISKRNASLEMFELLGKDGGVGGSISDFLRISKRLLGRGVETRDFRYPDFRRKRSSGSVDFGLPAHFRKTREFFDFRTSEKGGELVGRFQPFVLF